MDEFRTVREYPGLGVLFQHMCQHGQVAGMWGWLWSVECTAQNTSTVGALIGGPKGKKEERENSSAGKSQAELTSSRGNEETSKRVNA